MNATITTVWINKSNLEEAILNEFSFAKSTEETQEVARQINEFVFFLKRRVDEENERNELEAKAKAAKAENEGNAETETETKAEQKNNEDEVIVGCNGEKLFLGQSLIPASPMLGKNEYYSEGAQRDFLKAIQGGLDFPNVPKKDLEKRWLHHEIDIVNNVEISATIEVPVALAKARRFFESGEEPAVKIGDHNMPFVDSEIVETLLKNGVENVLVKRVTQKGETKRLFVVNLAENIEEYKKDTSSEVQENRGKLDEELSKQLEECLALQSKIDSLKKEMGQLVSNARLIKHDINGSGIEVTSQGEVYDRRDDGYGIPNCQYVAMDVEMF